MSRTPKKTYAGFSNAISSSRLCKYVRDFSHCKNLSGKGKSALLLAAEEIYGSSLQKSNYFCLYAIDLSKGDLKA